MLALNSIYFVTFALVFFKYVIFICIYVDFPLHTVGAWLNGTLNELLNTSQVINLPKLVAMAAQYTRDTETAKQRGFNSIFDDFDHATHEYKVAEQNDKVSFFNLFLQ